MPNSSPETAERLPIHSNGEAQDGRKDAMAAPEQQASGAFARSDFSEDLFEALDEIASVVEALEGEEEHREKRERLDQAGRKIVDTLVHEFSLKSAQVELLLRENPQVDQHWGDATREATRGNERFEEGGAVA